MDNSRLVAKGKALHRGCLRAARSSSSTARILSFSHHPFTHTSSHLWPPDFWVLKYLGEVRVSKFLAQLEHELHGAVRGVSGSVHTLEGVAHTCSSSNSLSAVRLSPELSMSKTRRRSRSMRSSPGGIMPSGEMPSSSRASSVVKKVPPSDEPSHPSNSPTWSLIDRTRLLSPLEGPTRGSHAAVPPLTSNEKTVRRSPLVTGIPGGWREDVWNVLGE